MPKNGSFSYICCPNKSLTRCTKWRATEILTLYVIPWNKWKSATISYENDCLINGIDLLSDCCFNIIDTAGLTTSIDENGSIVSGMGMMMNRELTLNISVPVSCDAWALLYEHINSRLVFIVHYNNKKFEVIGSDEGVALTAYNRSFSADEEIINLTYTDKGAEVSKYLSIGNEFIDEDERFLDTLTFLRQSQCELSECCTPPAECVAEEGQELRPSYYVGVPVPWSIIPDVPNPINVNGKTGIDMFSQLVGSPTCPTDTIVTIANITNPLGATANVTAAVPINGVVRWSVNFVVDRDYINSLPQPFDISLDLVFTGCCETKSYTIIWVSIKE